MGKQEIFKIQKPLHSSVDEVVLLVYNRSRSIYFQMNLTPELDKLFGDKYKIYVRGYIDDNQIFQVVNLESFQRW